MHAKRIRGAGTVIPHGFAAYAPLRDRHERAMGELTAVDGRDETTAPAPAPLPTSGA